jgi:hypothetical protein
MFNIFSVIHLQLTYERTNDKFVQSLHFSDTVYHSIRNRVDKKV